MTHFYMLVIVSLLACTICILQFMNLNSLNSFWIYQNPDKNICYKWLALSYRRRILNRLYVFKQVRLVCCRIIWGFLMLSITISQKSVFSTYQTLPFSIFGAYLQQLRKSKVHDNNDELCVYTNLSTPKSLLYLSICHYSAALLLLICLFSSRRHAS